MKNKLTFIFLLFVITSCSKLNDPKIGLNLGTDSSMYLSEISKLEQNGILSDKENESYIYYLKLKNSSIKTEMSINSDGYGGDNLRLISINLLGDTSYSAYTKDGKAIFKPHFIRAFGPRKISEVKNIYNYFLNYYGEPTKILNKQNMPSYGSLKEALESNDSFDLDLDKTIWEKENYYIEFITDYPVYDEYFKDSVYNKAFILFKTSNYENELAVLKENVRKTLKPNDLIKIENIKKPTFKILGNSYPYDREINVRFGRINRTGIEETRGITDIKFDIIFKTKFDEHICTIPNCIFAFEKPIKPFGENVLVNFSGFSYSSKYISGKDMNYEVLRSYLQKDIDFKVEADIKSVVFEDEEVLNM